MGRGWVNAVREAAGQAKGKLFTKIAKEIAVAVRLGGASPDTNARLRSALKDAQKNSVPKDTVERAIKRGSGGSGEAQLDEMLYEGYGPHGVAVLLEALTDNKNRTVQDLRAMFVRKGGALGESGSVQWMFDRIASIKAKPKKPGLDPEEAAINAGANEVEASEDDQTGEAVSHFIASPSDLDIVVKALEEAGWDVVQSGLAYRPKTPVTLTEEQEKDLGVFVAALHDNEDVKKFHLSVV
jgi:YebC/PmpR family DNA-binding regulatory protein